MSGTARSAAHDMARSFEIAPGYTADQWQHLSATLDTATVGRQPDGRDVWAEAGRVVKSRLQSRYLFPIDGLRKVPYTGFLIMAIDCMLLETLQGLIEGLHAQPGHSKQFFRDFLTSRDHFRASFSTPQIANNFYDNVRVGLLHDGETRNGWLIRIDQPTLLETRSDGYVIVDRDRFHDALTKEFDRYFVELSDPDHIVLRANLKRAMDELCRVGAP